MVLLEQKDLNTNILGSFNTKSITKIVSYGYMYSKNFLSDTRQLGTII